MTVKESGGRVNIAMTRGDSENITVRCSEPFAPGDTVYFTLREDAEGELLLQKKVTEFPEGEAILSFLPGDTEPLDFGSYLYDIQVTRADGTVTTIIRPSRFTLEEEVTYGWR